MRGDIEKDPLKKKNKNKNVTICGISLVPNGMQTQKDAIFTCVSSHEQLLTAIQVT